ncbi:hypothetical protein UC8_42690 [Roseimaritima ulvae]|uniref:HTH cro/C1-type domain-containing protein n=1 Tax=Roseimaritima ulvae TaxID=980254 RepID=A0A5B9QXW9_9BACT|nr:hypothetical protein UC8_42690 [Roseimaritima ulvae]
MLVNSQEDRDNDLPAAADRLDRIAEVRQSQGVTLRTISRRCGAAVRQLKAEERGDVELTLTALQRWAVALDVPIVELLAEPSEGLAAAVSQRAQLVRVMKTVEGLRAHAESAAMRRISDQLRDQLLEIMPELDEITAWPREGTRRKSGDVRRAVELPFRIDGCETGRDSLT